MRQISQIQRSLIVSALGLFLFGCERMSMRFDDVFLTRWSGSTNSISGTVQPIASSSALSLSKVTSLSCTTAEAKLIALDSSGKRILPAKATTQVQPNGRYSFTNLSSIGISSSSFLSSGRYIVEIHGCTESYARIVTGLNGQDVNYGTSLLSWVAETQNSTSLNTVATQKIAELNSLLSSSASVDAAFTKLTTDTTIATAFNTAFGAAPTALPEAAPRIADVTVPASFNELASGPLTATIKHWSSSYPIVYEWKVDGAVIATTASTTWVPNANSQGSHTISLRVGKDDGSGDLDLSKPIEAKSFSVTVNNNVLPTAPAFTTASSYVNNSNLTFFLNTGSLVSGVPANCASFSSLALVESDDASPVTTAPAAAAFTITCSGAGPQSLSYNLTTGEGIKTLRLWAQDASGQISSTPSTVQVQFSTTGPALTMSSPAAGSRVGATFSLTGTCTSSASHISITGDLSSPLTVPCSADSFTTPISLSGSDGSKTISLSQTDPFSNTTTISRSFVLDTASPVLAITAPAAASYVNAAGASAVSVTGTCSEDVTVQLNATSGSTTITASPACSSGAFSATLNLSSLTDGSVTLSANASDAALNAAAPVSLVVVKDTVAPAAVLSGTPSATSGVTTLNVTVSGTGLTHYQYKVGAASSVNCAVSGGYSSDVAVGATLTSDISGSPDSLMKLCVIGLDAAGNYQALASATSYTWTKDTVVSPFGTLSVTPVGPSQNNKPTISGSTEALSDVTLYAAVSCSGSALATASANGSGAFSLAPGSSIGSDGVYSFYVKSIDPFGNSLCSSALSYALDTTAPTVTLASTAASFTKISPVPVTATFSESVTGLSASDIAVTNGTVSGLTGSGTTYSFNVTPSGQGLVSITIPTGGAADAALNGNLASAVLTRTYDTAAPAVTITAPAANSSAQTGVTLAGACETGVPVDISGTGLLSSLQVACSSGSYSQFIYFSDADGAKSVSVAQTDAAGNVGTVSRSFVRDTTGPTLTQTTRASPYATNTNSATFGGACETGLTITVSGADTSTTTCSAGAWSFTTASRSTDASRTYTFTQTDSAGNQGQVSSTWVRDTVAPTLTFTSSSSFVTSGNSVTFQGACESGSLIAVSNAATASVSCSGGLWSYAATQTTDSAYTYAFTQTDAAGNSTPITGTWTRSTSGPTITVTQSTPQVTAGSTLTISGTCTGGTAGSDGTITITGAVTATTTCSSTTSAAGTWSYLATQSTDGSYTYNFTTSDNFSPVRTSSASLSWQRDVTVPQVTDATFSINGGTNPTFVSYNPVSFQATDNIASVTKFCLKTENTIPASTDACWYPVNGSATNVTPSNSVSISNYPFNIGIIPQVYNVYLWVMDGAGNVSSNTSTAGKDFAAITFSPVPPPAVNTVLAANSDTMNGTSSERTIPAGGDVFIRWTASGSGLTSTPVSLSFTTDDTNWTTLAAGLANGQNNCSSITGSGSVSTTSTGCYKWSGGSPSSSYYRVRATVTNSTGGTTQANSLPINAGQLQIIAGNTEKGLNGAASSAVFQASSTGDAWGDAQSLAVSSTGILYFRDITLGIVSVNPKDGKVTQLIPMGATTSGYGDGGSVNAAKLRAPVSIAMDGSDRLLILDYDRIRRVDFSTSPATIRTIIGGGSSTADTVTPATTLKYSTSHSSYTGSGLKSPMLALPNGDIYFFSDNPSVTAVKKVRVYSENNNTVTSISLSGSSPTVSNFTNSITDASKCGFQAPLLEYDPATSVVSNLYALIAANNTSTGCLGTPVLSSQQGTFMKISSSGVINSAQIPGNYFNTGGGSLPYASPVPSLDGKIYSIDRLSAYVGRFDTSTNAWVKVVGNGIRGACNDGTAATSCSIDPSGAFVDARGQVYFADRGRIRTILGGNVVTLYGQSLDYGDGGLATNARFMLNVSVAQRSDSGLIVYDTGTSKMRLFDRGGSIKTIAGNGSFGSNNGTTLPATSQSMPGSGSNSNFFLDSSDNIIYNESSSSVRMLANTYATSPTTTPWSLLKDSNNANWFNGATNFAAGDASGKLAGSISLGSLNDYRMMGFNGTSLLLFIGKYSTAYYDQVFSEVNLSTGLYTVDMGPAAGNTGFCADGTSLSSCALMRVPASAIPAAYDSTNSQWLFYDIDRKKIRTMGSGRTGTIETLTTLNNAGMAYNFKRFSGRPYVYYCSSNGRIYVRDVTSGTEAALNWPIASFSCVGTQMAYDSSTDSIIFAFTQNGMYGVAEVLNAHPSNYSL